MNAADLARVAVFAAFTASLTSFTAPTADVAREDCHARSEEKEESQFGLRSIWLVKFNLPSDMDLLLSSMSQW